MSSILALVHSHLVSRSRLYVIIAALSVVVFSIVAVSPSYVFAPEFASTPPAVQDPGITSYDSHGSNGSRRSTLTRTPVMYVHFHDDPLLGWTRDQKSGAGIIDVSFYLMHTLMASVWHGNPVWLVVRLGCEVHPKIVQRLEGSGGGVHYLNRSSWPHEWKGGASLLRRFRTAYRPWGMNEPWERENMERYFAVVEVMTLRNLHQVLYADSDVAVLAYVPRAIQQMETQMRLARKDVALKRISSDSPSSPPGSDGMHWDTRSSVEYRCDSWTSFDDEDDMLGKSSAFGWANWFGTALVSRDVLIDFLRFAVALYESKEAVSNILDVKRTKAPYVCDMTLSYLYRIAASARLRAHMSSWGDRIGMTRARRTLLAAVRRNATLAEEGIAPHDVRLCNIAGHPARNPMLAFDVTHGHKRPGFHFNPSTKKASVNGVRLFSIHFQGSEKPQAAELLAMFDLEGNPLKKGVQ